MKNSMLRVALCAAVGVSACGSQPDVAQTREAAGESALGLGATGPKVAAAQDYLRAYGYFPNDELAKQYSWWRPVVSEAPARPDVIDGNMQEALTRFQRNMGLTATGLLDEGSLAAMNQERCGVPDSDPSASSRVDKFAVFPSGNRWTQTNITYRFATAGGLAALNQNEVRGIIAAGIRAWETSTNLTFTEVQSGGDFAVTFGNIDGSGHILGQGNFPPSPSLKLDTSESWTVPLLLLAAMHEMGHVLGLAHSSFGNSSIGFPVMYPLSSSRTTLSDDDIIASNTLYNGWEQVGGLAIDIGANAVASGTGETVWILGTDKIPYRWNGAGWTQMPGVTGVRIDADAFGHAYVVDAGMRVWRHQSSQPNWLEVPGNGQAKDVGVGQNGALWVVGSDGRAWVFNSSANGWNFSGGPANQVAIDVTPSGQPWVLTSNGQLWALGSSWAQIGAGFGSSDVGIGGKLEGIATREWLFAIGQDGTPFIRDAQPALSVTCGTDCIGSSGAVDTWLPLGGTVSRISAGTHGRAWAVNAGNQIFRRKEVP